MPSRGRKRGLARVSCSTRSGETPAASAAASPAATRVERLQLPCRGGGGRRRLRRGGGAAPSRPRTWRPSSEQTGLQQRARASSGRSSSRPPVRKPSARSGWAMRRLKPASRMCRQAASHAASVPANGTSNRTRRAGCGACAIRSRSSGSEGSRSERMDLAAGVQEQLDARDGDRGLQRSRALGDGRRAGSRDGRACGVTVASWTRHGQRRSAWTRLAAHGRTVHPTPGGRSEWKRRGTLGFLSTVAARLSPPAGAFTPRSRGLRRRLPARVVVGPKVDERVDRELVDGVVEESRHTIARSRTSR